MAITTLVAVTNVAGVRAVFPVSIAVGSKGPPTAGTGEFVNSLFVYHIGMSIPPVLTAVRRAEFYQLPSGHLRDGLTAVLAAACRRLFLHMRLRFYAG